MVLGFICFPLVGRTSGLFCVLGTPSRDPPSRGGSPGHVCAAVLGGRHSGPLHWEEGASVRPVPPARALLSLGVGAHAYPRPRATCTRRLPHACGFAGLGGPRRRPTRRPGPQHTSEAEKEGELRPRDRGVGQARVEGRSWTIREKVSCRRRRRLLLQAAGAPGGDRAGVSPGCSAG